MNEYKPYSKVLGAEAVPASTSSTSPIQGVLTTSEGRSYIEIQCITLPQSTSPAATSVSSGILSGTDTSTLPVHDPASQTGSQQPCPCTCSCNRQLEQIAADNQRLHTDVEMLKSLVLLQGQHIQQLKQGLEALTKGGATVSQITSMAAKPKEKRAGLKRSKLETQPQATVTADSTDDKDDAENEDQDTSMDDGNSDKGEQETDNTTSREHQQETGGEDEQSFNELVFQSAPKASQGRGMKRRHHRKWTEEDFQRGLEFIQSGKSVRSAGKKFNIPESTLRSRIRLGRTAPNPIKAHREGVLLMQETSLLIQQARFLHYLDIPVLIKKMCRMAGKLVGDRRGIPNHSLSVGWWHTFQQQHPEILPYLSKYPGTLPTWGAELAEHFNKKAEPLLSGLEAEQVYVIGLMCWGPAGQVCQHHTGQCEHSISEDHLTMAICASAQGSLLSPALCNKYTDNNSPPEEGMMDALYIFNESGTLDEYAYLRYLQYLAPSFPEDQPVVIFQRHNMVAFTDDVMSFCIERDITLVSIPTMLQALRDPMVSIIQELHTKLGYCSSDSQGTMSPDQIPGVLESALMLTGPDCVQQAFTDKGLYPYTNVEYAEQGSDATKAKDVRSSKR